MSDGTAAGRIPAFLDALQAEAEQDHRAVRFIGGTECRCGELWPCPKQADLVEGIADLRALLAEYGGLRVESDRAASQIRRLAKDALDAMTKCDAATARAEQRVLWMYGTRDHSSEHAYVAMQDAQEAATWEHDPSLAEYPEYWSWEPCPPQDGRLAMLCGDDRTGYTVWPVTVIQPRPRPQQPTAEAELPDRQAKVLAAIRRWGGEWVPMRARTVLAEAGYAVTKERAHQIMKQLAERGYLEPIRPRAYTYRLKTDTPQQAPQDGVAP